MACFFPSALKVKAIERNLIKVKNQFDMRGSQTPRSRFIEVPWQPSIVCNYSLLIEIFVMIQVVVTKLKMNVKRKKYVHIEYTENKECYIVKRNYDRLIRFLSVRCTKNYHNNGLE